MFTGVLKTQAESTRLERAWLLPEERGRVLTEGEAADGASPWLGGRVEMQGDGCLWCPGNVEKG